jgi:enolase
LGISMAFVDACAKNEWKWIYEYLGKWEWTTLPYPMMNILNWGSHADNNVDIQEFMIVPVWAKNIREAVRMWAEIFHTLKKILKSKWHVTSVWDEGWYAPNLGSNEEAFKVIVDAIQQAGYNTDQVKLAIDAAASEFHKDGKYNMEWEGRILNSAELVDFYADMVSKYPIMAIEDGLDEDDFDGWKIMQEKLWDKIMSIWDDLLVTNIERLKMSIDENLCNSILIKLNQIGSVSETLAAVKMAHENGMKAVISHRSGETEDTFIADLAVALNTGFIKTGSLSRTDRVAKYNQLIRIEEKLGEKAKYGK